jgi:hypothetical protein
MQPDESDRVQYRQLYIHLFVVGLRVFEDNMPRRTFGLKRDKVSGGWRKLHNEELRNFSAPSIITTMKSRRVRLAGFWVRKPEGKRPLETPRHGKR